MATGARRLALGGLLLGLGFLASRWMAVSETVNVPRDSLAHQAVSRAGASTLGTASVPGTASTPGESPISGITPGLGAAPNLDGFVGVVVAERRVDIAAPGDAVVEEIPARLGLEIAAGEVVASLNAADLRLRRGRVAASVEAARARFEQARARSKSSAATLERFEKLSDTISAQELATARLEADVARAGLAAAAADVEGLLSELAEVDDAVERALVRAPFSGTVAARYVDPGSWVAAGQGIATLVSRDLLVRLAIPPTELCRVGIGDPVELFDFDDGRRLGSARVTRLAPELDSSSNMVLAEAELDGQGSLRSQKAVRVRSGAPPCLSAGETHPLMTEGLEGET